MLFYPLLLLREGIHFIYFPKSALDSSVLDFSPIPNLRKMSFNHSFLLKGLISLNFSINSSIIVPCSVNPCFWERVGVACQTFLLSSCIALSFHTTRKDYSTLIDSFGRGMILDIYIEFKQESLLSSFMSLSFQTLEKCHLTTHFLAEGIESSVFSKDSSIILIALSIHAFGRGWLLHVKLFFYHPTLLCHSMLLGKTTLPLLTPLGGG